MHEFSLYGTVSRDDYAQLKQQLTGVARMQAREVKEIHLLFRAKPPTGLSNLPSAGGSQGVMQQDVQRIKTMLNASLYYVQLVGEVLTDEPGTSQRATPPQDVPMEDSNGEAVIGSAAIRWTLEFKDTPDPGKQSVSSRLISRIPLGQGNLVQFVEQFGYEYVSRYYIRGSKFYDQDTTLFLHEILQLPQATQDNEEDNITKLPPFADLLPVDPGRKFLLQASIHIMDGNHPELKDKATKQLLAMKNTLRQAVNLSPGDRLALDTKVPITRRP